ncbi:MAG: hypothetical protein HDR14_09830 [Lachnospiraceae bacterium]|nr:hypothetical protein [Lachnospiraceae bacterium]
MAFLKIEQETLISFNAGEDTAELYTADPVMIRKMDKLVSENPEQFKGEVHSRYQGKVYAMNYILPKRFISIRTKDIVRNTTEKQRERAREQLIKYHALRHAEFN